MNPPTIRYLIETSQKRDGTFYTRLVNRRLGAVLAHVAARVGLSPVQVTVLSFLATSVGIVLTAVGSTAPRALAAYAMLVVGFALDSADGQLARATARARQDGTWCGTERWTGGVISYTRPPCPSTPG